MKNKASSALFFIFVKFFVSDSELEKIDKKIKKSKMTKSDYLRTLALGKEIVIIEDFKEFFQRGGIVFQFLFVNTKNPQ